MAHAFYNLGPKQQRLFQLKLATGFILFNLLAGLLLFLTNLLLFIPFVMAISLTIYAPFLDMPSGIKDGSLKYYSPLLIGEKVRNQRLVLHSGSLFDYYFVFNKNQTIRERKRLVFSAYIDGLLNLIEHYQKQQPTQITIKITSYILNRRTAQKLGLQPVETDMAQRLILYFNFFNLLCSLSYLNNKLTWPQISKISTYQGELDALIAKKADLLALQQKFKVTPDAA